MREILIAQAVAKYEQLDQIEGEITKITEQLSQTDSEGYGVQTEYDYDYGWIVEELNDSEWEMYASGNSFRETVEIAQQLAAERGDKCRINTYRPPTKYIRQYENLKSAKRGERL